MRAWHDSSRTWSLIAIALAGCLGCSGQGTTLEGSVTFDGQPVEKGSITFEPADGIGPAAGGTIADGRYRLDAESGLAPGEKIVRINAVRATGKKMEAGPPEPPGTMVDEVVPYIPANYNENSTLKVQVAPGHGTHDFALQSQPSR